MISLNSYRYNPNRNNPDKIINRQGCCCVCKCVCCCCVRPCPPPEPEPPLPPEECPGIEPPPYDAVFISTAEELAGLRNYLGSEYRDRYFRLANDIDLTDYLSPDGPGYNHGAGWEPIGSWYPTFQATLDGGGYKITGLWSNRPGTDFIGLFGRIDNGRVINLNVELASEGIRGSYQVGVITGAIADGVIRNCHVHGTLAGTSLTGGITGYVGGSNERHVDIENCSAVCDISAYYGNTGGLVGFCSGSGTIGRCYSAGSVTGSSYIGGFAGNASNSRIRNCYTLSDVTAHDILGGFAGSVGQYSHITLENCYAAGRVDGESFTAGFIGYNINSTIISCFFDIDTTGWDYGVASGSIDGVTGLTNAQMRTLSIFTNAGWDFYNIWNISPERNSGYPYLRCVY